MGHVRGAERMTYTLRCDSPLGELLLAARGGALVGLWLEGQKYYPELPAAEVRSGAREPVLLDAKRWLEAYFAGERPEISALALKPEGSEFRRRVWRRLCAIPYGEVVSYGEIARELARERGLESFSAQAAGGAVGHNPISIIIPCHRVVGSGGSLTGYAGGVERKLWLLRHEGANTLQLIVPKKGTAL